MEIKITSEEYNNILILKTQGEVNGWERLTDEIYEEVKKHNCRKIIIDHSLLKFSSSIVHAVDLVKHYKDNFPSDIRLVTIAVVVPENNREFAEFWETYCNNSGYKYFSFTSMNSATEWIMSY